jgi:hypothetical protein
MSDPRPSFRPTLQRLESRDVPSTATELLLTPPAMVSPPVSAQHLVHSPPASPGHGYTAELATAVEWEFALALAAESQRWAALLVQQDHGQTPLPQEADYANTFPLAGLNPFLADKPQPLSDAELSRLEKLVARGDKVTDAERLERQQLLERLKGGGMKLDGADALRTLERLLAAGQKALSGDARNLFLGMYRDGLNLALGGLQKIDEGRYQLYKQARNNGATHDEAWTWAFGGDTALRRYTLEKLIEKAK